MAGTPKVYNCFWQPIPFGPERPSPLPVALQHKNIVDTRPPMPARLLFPALLTPAVHVMDFNQGMIELLLAAPKSPPIKAAHVNLHLKIVAGLHATKKASRMPLFGNPKDKILVEPITPDGNGILKTKNLFRGILDARVREHLPKNLDGFYAVQVHQSCLETLHAGGEAIVDEEDVALLEMLKRLNGKSLRGDGNRGTHEFMVSGAGVDVGHPNAAQPIVAYHPLYVHEAGALDAISVGHASDIHLSARQDLLQRSPARVIDAPTGTGDSPAIGNLMNTCTSSFASILNQLGAADIVLVGGDLIDHIQNTYAFQKDDDLRALEHPTARKVWDLVDLETNYDTNYQAFVDYVSFYSFMRHFIQEHQKPLYGITGNHDCYEEAYGTSPRVAARMKRANEGIPADNNLTFYEAMLVFGETWHIVRRQLRPPNFTIRLFEWFYTVLTPFSDYAFNFPKQRLVGLAWGEDEEIMSGPGSWGQGLGHLPRAEEAVTAGQLALFNDALSSARRTILLTHFTFVSYDDSIAIADAPVPGSVDVGGPGIFRRGDPFGKNDLGTFEKLRSELYAGVANSDVMSFVVTGHSHRKGLYFLGAHDGNQYATSMYSLRQAMQIPSKGPTPIIVSDSAGPLPRLTLSNVVMAQWGSDRPGGTLVHVGADGRPSRVEAVPSQTTTAMPRLAVALDYAHILLDKVFDSIEVAPFDGSRATTTLHTMNVTFKKDFPVDVMGSLILYGRASVAAPWTTIPLSSPTGNPDPSMLSFRVPLSQSKDFFEWLTFGSSAGRFVSFGFKGAAGLDHLYDTHSRWNFEVESKASKLNSLPFRDQRYEIRPYAQGMLSRTPEAPNFDWRRQFPEYQ